MKILKSFILAFSLIVGFTSVNGQEKSINGSVNDVINAYLGIKNSLTTDDNAGAKSSAKQLLASLSAVHPDKFTAEQKAVWTKYVDKLEYDSRHISDSPLDHQREHFASLSKNILGLVKGMKVNTATLYAQYCPMKKVSWLSETPTIRNPYFGKQMPGCGKTTETLNAAK